MDDRKKTKTQLLSELAALRQQVTTLQNLDAAHRRWEADLQEARLDAESIVETVREPLVILDGDLRILAANRAFYRTFQVTPKETEHQVLYELGNRQWDIPALRQLLETILPAGLPVHDFEVTHEFPTIGHKVMLLNARRIDRNTQPTRTVLLAIEDITERQRAERLLQQYSEWLTVTLTSIGDGVIATDAAALITFMNPEAERLTGWRRQDALGREVTEVLVLLNEETRQVIDHPIKRVLREGIVVGLANHTLLVRRDGQEIPIADSGAPIRGTDGTLHGVVMVFRDITERSAMEKHLVQARDAAEAADRAKSEFLATMSHELRTPLAVIIGYTDLMIDNAFGAVTVEERDILQRVRRNAVELLDLIVAMLDLSRLEAGRMPVQVHEVQLPTLLQELAEETREIWEPAHLQLRWQAEENLPPIATDPAKLKVVLKNLIGNAVKFTPQGHITMQAHRQGGGIEVCVTDTGIGIPPHALALIFEPFRQVETDGRSVQRGTGLGLYIVKRLLVDLLNGTVEVESEVGKGSTFRVWLPTSRNPMTS